MNTIIDWLFGSGSGDYAGGGEWRLDFVAQYSNYAKLALLMVCAAMIYLTIRSYLREGDTKRRIKLSLAALRIAVVVLVFVVLFRPAIVWRYTKTVFSSVVVLVDDSLSMGYKDRYAADSKEGKALADKLHVSPAELANMSRTEVVRKLLPEPLLKLGTEHPIQIVRFSTTQPGDNYTNVLGTIEDLLKKDKSAKPQSSSAPAYVSGLLATGLKSDGYETDYATALRQGVDGLQSKRAYIVMVGDGRLTVEGTGSNRLDAARTHASQLGYPVYTICVGDDRPPKNLAIISVQAPREVRKNSTVSVVAKLSQRGLAGQTVNCKLLARNIKDEKDFREVKSMPVKLDGDADRAEESRAEQTIEFSFEPDKEGQYVYRVAVEERPDEQNTKDNFADALVKVTEKQIKILLVSGDAGFEFQFLKNYLLGQPDYYRISVWQESADKDVNQASSTGMKLDKFPNTLEAIMGGKEIDPKTKLPVWPGYDMVILYDPMPTDGGFDKAFAENLNKAIGTHNIGLCYIAGNKYTASTLGTNNAFTALRAMMPVRVSNHDLPDVGDSKPVSYPLRPTGYGLEHQVLRLGSNTDETIKLWDEMPGIYWSHSLRGIEPLARVLAENSNDTRRMDKVAEPLIVTRPFGQGRVLYMNTDETWRWKAVEDGKYYREFWGNVIKYLTPTASRKVIITAGGDRFPAGEQITIEVEAYSDDYSPLKAKEFTVVVIDKQTGEKKEVKLSALPDKEGRYRGQIPKELTAHVGDYEVNVPNPEPDQVEPKDFHVDLPQAEAARPESDPILMANTASKADFALRASQTDQLANLIPPGNVQTVSESRRELWDTKLMLLIIVMLLTIEWILRKKYNMA